MVQHKAFMIGERFCGIEAAAAKQGFRPAHAVGPVRRDAPGKNVA
jgi:hypothetical protein